MGIFKDAIEMKKKLVHGSTFSGIGAPELAAEMVGWENAFHCEINPFGRAVLDFYYPDSKSYEDITKTDFSEWGGRIDVLTGGFPCQPFSYAGKRRGSQDDRYLWPYMLKCIHQIRPTWFIGENVAGIASMVFPGEDVKVGSNADIFNPGDLYRKDERYVITEICENLEHEGYSVQPLLIPACAVGAPHRRDRVFFIAYRNPSPDTDCGNDGSGIAREDESASGEKRISERNEVRQSSKSDSVRSKNGAASSDTSSTRGNKGQCDIQSEASNVAEPLSISRQRNVTDTECERLEGKNESGNSERRKWLQIRRDFAGYDRQDGEGEYGWLLPCNRWRSFPTVSAVYRGNDGFPFDVDNLTIPFTRWKTESLKAYGNAIVVQVMYEIFRAIDMIENETLR